MEEGWKEGGKKRGKREGRKERGKEGEREEGEREEGRKQEDLLNSGICTHLLVRAHFHYPISGLPLCRKS